jgi:hypothetical protein
MSAHNFEGRLRTFVSTWDLGDEWMTDEIVDRVGLGKSLNSDRMHTRTNLMLLESEGTIERHQTGRFAFWRKP